MEAISYDEKELLKVSEKQFKFYQYVNDYYKQAEKEGRVYSGTTPSSAERMIAESLPQEVMVIKATDLIEKDIPEPKHILKPWIAEETITLIVGKRGEGKTWFGMGIANAITMGHPKFGPWEIFRPVPVLYVDGELSLHGIQQRLNLLGHSRQGEKAPLLIYSSALLNSKKQPAINLYDPIQREIIKNFCETEGVKVLFLGNIASLCPGADENLKKDWDPINQWLLTLRFNGVSTLMLHHTNKNGDQRGTSGREDNVDNSILLTHPKEYEVEDGIRFEVKFTKNRLDYDHLSQMTNIEMVGRKTKKGQIEFDYQDTYLTKKALIQKKLIAKEKVVSIAKELDVSERYVYRIQKALLN